MPATKRQPDRRLPHHITTAIKTGPVPVIRDVHWLWDNDWQQLTKGEQVIVFAERNLIVATGMKKGQPLVLDDFQRAFFLSVLDNPGVTEIAVSSRARRNSKTYDIAVLIFAFLIGPLAEDNVTIASAAHSREQAAQIFGLMKKTIEIAPKYLARNPGSSFPDLSQHLHVVPSAKQITALANGSEYFAMSADATVGHGKDLKVVVFDESGQARGPSSDYIEMLMSSGGSNESPLFITISTQAPSDQDWLSTVIDDAIREEDPHTVVHLYTHPEDRDIMDQDAWVYSNPGIDQFRSRRDLEKGLERARRLPASQAGAMNLLLNMRVAQTGLWLGPEAWKACGQDIDLTVFRENLVAAGLDLSARQDLTAAVLAACGADGVVHLLPFVYCPLEGLEARTHRDRTPYATWVRDGQLIGLAGASMDYEQILEHLQGTVDELGITVSWIEYDRWRVDVAKAAAERVGAFSGAEWHEVGQGYRNFAPRTDCFERLLLNGQIAHGNHPLLTMAAANAIATQDPAGNKKLDKSKTTARIDPLVAAVMATFAVTEGLDELETSIYTDMSREVFM